MLLLLRKKQVLLDVQMRIYNLPGMYGRQHMGHVMQWNHMGMSGLRRAKRTWKPVTYPY